MQTQTVQIINKLGLHARASSKFTQTAAQFQSEIWVTRNGKRVNGKSIMGLMMLAAAKGTEIEIETIGADEIAALNTLVALINDYFGEGE
ncbi:HPr family phosphocarrier protein [Kingella negevensis]|uniref:HPr-like protein Crh n=1 Tax=Kingella negevensis TaxID=1522312 RepID=A0A238HHG0_9NEIS|nr:HPr family phosphocarrier protein [Kingella negevensis]MDK4681337.1 HPr family phosphocarrier protein [Kingella negevensis]MDK4683534.1 HPr family phosphocarrier protein [Kingella negevensis]MDK4691331.1 HPr family phosphocarrier protein [Kingella negevensis]MDK4693520.1 HPr family phosphocarrier protein [Kingella negevensis]MDK4697418.1 HPr family phosphocarrier protein [Kingella negevensis]